MSEVETTRKIVVNRCWGGFGLSHEAMLRYAELKGITLYPETGRFGHITYWTKPKATRTPPLPEPWSAQSLEARRAYNEASSGDSIYDGDIERDDPALVQVVEELGEKANGRYAKLDVANVPADVDWEIDDYDGQETVREKHRSW